MSRLLLTKRECDFYFSRKSPARKNAFAGSDNVLLYWALLALYSEEPNAQKQYLSEAFGRERYLRRRLSKCSPTLSKV